jgi:hypothetical protein
MPLLHLHRAETMPKLDISEGRLEKQLLSVCYKYQNNYFLKRVEIDLDLTKPVWKGRYKKSFKIQIVKYRMPFWSGSIP